MPAITLRSFPRAILHIDGDSFFASCETALNPKLKGLPVVTGAERGIASSMSYEAKARGVTRGMRLSEIKRVCPGVIILPSDYETYSLFSVRMYEIVRRYTSAVEEYSIDECFAELTGLRRPLKMPYHKIAEKIKHDLDTELGMTFSVGLAPTKVLAKAASKWKKPNGLTVIPGYNAHLYLAELPLEKIWGIGPNTTAYLNQEGLHTALDLAQKDEDWVKARLTKPFYEIWQELRGNSVLDLNLLPHDDYQSISKTRTFTPPSAKKDYVFSQLSKNIENACIKARRHQLTAREFFFFVKTQEFRYSGLEIKLPTATAVPNEIITLAAKYFSQIYRPKTLYRATGITLLKLSGEKSCQLDLFGQAAKNEKLLSIFNNVDKLSAKYGKHTVFLGVSLEAMVGNQHDGGRGLQARRKTELFRGENKRQRLDIPLFGQVT